LADDNVRVAAGALKLVVSRSELRAGTSHAAPRKKPPPRAAPVEHLEVPVQTRDNTCDLRGMRADEALSMAQSFLDRAMGEGQKVVFFIHGHGTGALRDVIRRELASSPYARAHRPGERYEGGDGVTVAWLH